MLIWLYFFRVPAPEALPPRGGRLRATEGHREGRLRRGKKRSPTQFLTQDTEKIPFEVGSGVKKWENEFFLLPAVQKRGAKGSSHNFFQMGGWPKKGFQSEARHRAEENIFFLLSRVLSHIFLGKLHVGANVPISWAFCPPPHPSSTFPAPKWK